jgi:hypothetical protein
MQLLVLRLKTDAVVDLPTKEVYTVDVARTEVVEANE